MNKDKQLLIALKVLYNKYSKDEKAKEFKFFCNYIEFIKDYLGDDYFIIEEWINITLKKALKKYNPEDLNKFGIPFPMEFLKEYLNNKDIERNDYLYLSRLKLLESEIKRLEQRTIISIINEYEIDMNLNSYELKTLKGEIINCRFKKHKAIIAIKSDNIIDEVTRNFVIIENSEMFIEESYNYIGSNYNKHILELKQ